MLEDEEWIRWLQLQEGAQEAVCRAAGRSLGLDAAGQDHEGKNAFAVIVQRPQQGPHLHALSVPCCRLVANHA